RCSQRIIVSLGWARLCPRLRHGRYHALARCAAGLQDFRRAGGHEMTIRKSTHVKRPIAAAFRVFTEDIGRWWPLKDGYSFGGARADQIYLEGKQGGRFFERFTDGEEFVVGLVK